MQGRQKLRGLGMGERRVFCFFSKETTLFYLKKHEVLRVLCFVVVFLKVSNLRFCCFFGVLKELLVMLC